MLCTNFLIFFMFVKRKGNNSTTPYNCILRRDLFSELTVKEVAYKLNVVSCLKPFYMVSPLCERT